MAKKDDRASIAKALIEQGIDPENVGALVNKITQVPTPAVVPPPPEVNFARIKPTDQKTYDRLIASGNYQSAPGGYLQHISSNIPASTPQSTLKQIVTQSNQQGAPATLPQLAAMMPPKPAPTQNMQNRAAPQPTTASPESLKSIVKKGPPMTKQDLKTQRLIDTVISEGKPINTGAQGGYVSIPGRAASTVPKRTEVPKGLKRLFGKKVDTNFWNRYYKNAVTY